LLGLNEDQITELEKTKEVQTNLILPGDKMWIYGDVYEYELNWVKKGSHIKVRPVSLAGEEFFGEIVSINPVVDPRTRSVRFRALIDNPNKKLKPEMYVDVEIMSQYVGPDGSTEVLSIPKSALLDTGRRRIVWVDKGNGQFEGRAVEVGPESIGHSEQPLKFYPVLKGLKEGEHVVTKGNFLIDSQSQITGVAASSYSGALEPAAPQGSMGHSH
jgi:Cu(I)/Ag(I) efflux system membrane fusion protein